MDYTYRERHGEAIYRFKDGMLPSDFFRRNIVLSFQEDAIGIRLRDVIGVDNMMWGSDYPRSESTFPQSWKILAEILEGVPNDEQAKPAPDPDPGIAGGNTARVYNFEVARLTGTARRAFCGSTSSAGELMLATHARSGPSWQTRPSRLKRAGQVGLAATSIFAKRGTSTI